MIVKILVTFFTLIITIFVFQNCSNSSDDNMENLNASATEKTEYSQINFLEYYPNYFKTISPSKILAVSNAKKILVESTRVEHPGLIEIDVIQNLKYKKIDNMPSNSKFSYSFDGHYLLALA